jgi:imidazolonepropionase-like amidohydrolase
MLIATTAFAQRSTTVFRDVTVLPMDSQRTLPHTTVLVEGGKIVRLGPVGSTEIPANVRVIDGRGKFLIPGFADMHMHIDRAEEMPLFLAAGVTTTLNMGLASPGFVTETRREIERGDLPSPQVFVSFLIDGPGDPGPEYVPVCPPDARAAVDRARLVGYDFIKAYSRLQPDIYAAVLDEAKKQGIAVVGHIPPSVGLEKALAAGQVMVAHGEEYYKTFFDDKPDESQIGRAVELTKEAGAYVTPNLSFFAALTERVAHPEFIDAQLARSESKLVPPDMRGVWMSGRSNSPSDRFVPELALIRKLTLAMSRAGVPLLAGTDTPAGAMVPGYSLDDDLEQLVIAGLTPYQALAAATRTPGEFIRKYVPGARPFGTIAEGQRADLVLLEKNPLDDIANVQHPLGVMAAGHWYTAAELKALVEKPLAGYQRIEHADDAFRQNVTTRGAAVAVREYRAGKDEPKLTESFVNSLGYELIAQKRFEDAIPVLSLNTELYPESWNAYDSLGEAYLDAGNIDLAVVNYRHSLALNGHNAGAQRVLEKAGTMPRVD